MTKNKRLDDLKLAKYCISMMKKTGTYNDHMIGVVVDDFGGMVTACYKKGDIVIYRCDFEMIFGEKKMHKTMTVEKSITRKWMRENLKNGTISKVKITDIVSGEVTTVGELTEDIKDILEKKEIILDNDSILYNMLNDIDVENKNI